MHPSRVALFIPDNLKKFKFKLFKRIGESIEKRGGRVIMHDPSLMDKLPTDIVPIVGCHPELRSRIDSWSASGREFIYWDRGYAVRIFATWLRRPVSGSGYYRWTRNAFQMKRVREVPKDRWKELRVDVAPWNIGGRHIVIAKPSATYDAFHRTDRWLEETIEAVKKYTDRPIVIREKLSKIPLAKELNGAHCLVTHQSNAAIESVIFGCPVFVDPGSASALVGLTDLSQIESPVYPERKPWLWSLAYSQFDEDEIMSGKMWGLID